MNAEKILQLEKLHSEIQNFRNCYQGDELWGDMDGPVSAESLMAFLIENPHYQKIANEIAKLEKETEQ